jgi:hypothetical protein
MITLPDFKKLLGPYGESLSDEKIEQLFAMEQKIADIFIDQWLEKRNQIIAENEHDLRDNEGGIEHENTN